MMQSGFLLVRSSCDEFFSNAAILQRDAQIGRDMIAPIITVLTGIIALKKFSSAQSDRYLNILNLGSNAVLAGISLVDKHFLFDSDNIADVRELTFKAIAADEKGITDNGTDSFETGMSQLIEHQAICTPAYIARLTKQAIKATEITPDTGAGNPTDQAALAKLGDVLGLLGPATPQQALALMALYQAGVPGTAVPANLVNYLKVQHLDSLVQPGNPLSNPGTITVEGTQKQQKIVEALGGFSNETHAKLVRNVPKVLLGTARSLADVTIQPGNNTRNVELIVR
ncbi:MAG: hypothetical protein QOH04_2914 [Sphingomonadales bacterium]|nr:hypothetical protein [Sphingomonadales bacterium]